MQRGLKVMKIKHLNDVLRKGETGIAIFTDNRYPDRLKIKSGKKMSSSGNWRIDTKRQFKKVIIYSRHDGKNEIYIGDYAGTTEVTDQREKRFVIYFQNARSIGIVDTNWCEFANSGSYPVRYSE
jgi:hypothetical protein